MERRKFIKYSSFASLGAGLLPIGILGEFGKQSISKVIQFSTANTQIRHGALNLSLSKSFTEELPFDWLLDVQQNIFLKDGFQRNEAEDMHIISIALKNENELEALQVSVQQSEIGFYWKDQFVLQPSTDGLHKVNIKDDNYTFQLVSIDSDQELTIKLDEYKNYFFQVVVGEVQNQALILNTNNGLAALSEKDASYTFHSIKPSKLLIISTEHSA